jgi:hypothetical protein
MRRVLALVVLCTLAVAAGCGADSKYDELKAPESVDRVSETTTTIGELEKILLPGVGGTTTTAPVAVGPGPATIVGRVDGPDGPVGGALVQLERLVGDRFASIRVPTAADGTWNAQRVLGGRYRIRAWLSPELGMAEAMLTFVDATRQANVVLKLERFGQSALDAAIAPNPPVVDEPVNIAVRVRTRRVDANGFVRDVPATDVVVTLSGEGAWSGSSTAVTGADGIARFELECTDDGPQPLTASLDDGTSRSLDLPACVSD